MTNFEDVRAFHVKFELPHDGPDKPVQLLTPEVFSYRFNFLTEELTEYETAHNNKDLVKAVDSLVDFVYVALGTALFMRGGSHAAHMTTPWPTWDSTNDGAMRMGLCAGRTRVPALLPHGGQKLIEHRLWAEVDGFELSHKSGLPSAVPMCMAHLWNAAWGAYLGAMLMNVPWVPCWNAVHAANMAKVRADATGKNSKRGTPWDVVKPAGWTSPDRFIQQALIEAGATI